MPTLVGDYGGIDGGPTFTEAAFYEYEDGAWQEQLTQAPGEVAGYAYNGYGRFIAVNY